MSSNDKRFIYDMTTATNYYAFLSYTLKSTEETYCVGPTARNELNAVSAEITQPKDTIQLLECPLLAGETTTIRLEVQSTTNVLGSLENRFVIAPVE